MLSIGKSSFEDTRAIKVLVVPIGENSLFDSHFQTISVMRDTSVAGLSKPSSWTKENNQGFKHFDWSKGNLIFDYLRYDRVPNGPGDLDEFQSSRRVLMIVGLINYPELGNDPAEKIQQELEYFTRRHPNVILRRLFLFNYPFQGSSIVNDPYKELITPKLAGKLGDPNLLVVFPPDLSCAGGSMVKVHLGVNVDNAAATIISAFGDQMRICDNAAKKNVIPDAHYQIPLTTFFDEIEERKSRGVTDESPRGLNASSIMKVSSLSTPKNTYKKKPSGRIRKWMGDLSMQTCSPRDALEHYSASIDVSRANDDQMWLAGALEGYAAAIILAIKLGQPLEEILVKDLKTVTAEGNQGAKDCSVVVKALLIAQEKAAEAIRLYSTNVIYCGLEVECALRVAKMQEAIGVDLRKHRWYGREQRAWAYVLHAMSVPGLNMQQQVECAIEGALICKRMQLKRKYAFLLYVASLMCAENDNVNMAHALVRNACSQYGISTDPLPCINNGASPFSVGASVGDSKLEWGDREPNRELRSDIIVAEPCASWHSIQESLLVHGARLASEAGDPKSSARFTAALLRHQSRRATTALSKLVTLATTIAPCNEWSNTASFINKIRSFRNEIDRGDRLGSTGRQADSNEDKEQRIASMDGDVYRDIMDGNYSSLNNSSNHGTAMPLSPLSRYQGFSAKQIPGSGAGPTSFVAARSAQVSGDWGSQSLHNAGYNSARHLSEDSMSHHPSPLSHHATVSSSDANSTKSSSSSFFLSQIGLMGGSSANSDNLIKDSFSASMIAMIAQQQQQQSSLSAGAGALAGVGISAGSPDFYSYNATTEDIDLRCSYGVSSTALQSFSRSAIAVKAQQYYRGVGLPEELRNLAIRGQGGAETVAFARESISGSAGSRFEPTNEQTTPASHLSFSSILQNSPLGSQVSGYFSNDAFPLLDSNRFSVPLREDERNASEVSNSARGSTLSSLCLLTGVIARELSSVIHGGGNYDSGGDARLTSSSITSALQAGFHRDAMSWLSAQAKRLAPGYSVILPELLVRLKPLALPSGIRPEAVQAICIDEANNAYKKLSKRLASVHGTHAEANAGAESVETSATAEVGSSLYYNPFLTKEAGEYDQDKDTPLQLVIWAINTLCKVTATFYNPLGTPVRFSNVRLRLSGCPHRTLPVTVVVPPMCICYEVELSVMPLGPGNLCIEGVEASIESAITVVRVDSRGWALSSLQEECPCNSYSVTRGKQPEGAEVLIRNRWKTVFGSAAVGSGLLVNKDLVGGDDYSSGGCVGRIASMKVHVVPQGPCALLQTQRWTDLGESTTFFAENDELQGGPVVKRVLYEGEELSEWIKIGTAPRDDTSILWAGGMADIADLCVKVRHHIRHNGGQALREETLLPFNGCLQGATGDARTYIGNTDFVKVTRACVIPNDMPLSELVSLDERKDRAVQVLSMPLQFPISFVRHKDGKVSQSGHGEMLEHSYGTGGKTLCLQLQWKHHKDVTGTTLRVDVVGASDPCAEVIQDLSKDIEKVLNEDDEKRIVAVASKYEQFGSLGGIVRCRRGELRVRVGSAKSLTAEVNPLADCISRSPDTTSATRSRLYVLTLRNHTASPMRVLTDNFGEEACVEIVESGENNGQGGSGDWIRPRCVNLTLPAHSTRNLVLEDWIVGPSGEMCNLKWRLDASGRRGVVRVSDWE